MAEIGPDKKRGIILKTESDEGCYFGTPSWVKVLLQQSRKDKREECSEILRM